MIMVICNAAVGWVNRLNRKCHHATFGKLAHLSSHIPAGSSGLGSTSRSAALTDFDLNMPLSSSSLGGLGSGLSSGLGGSSSNASSRQVQQSYSSYSSSSADGGRPHVEFSKDSTYRDDPLNRSILCAAWWKVD